MPPQENHTRINENGRIVIPPHSAARLVSNLATPLFCASRTVNCESPLCGSDRGRVAAADLCPGTLARRSRLPGSRDRTEGSHLYGGPGVEGLEAEGFDSRYPLDSDNAFL